MERKMITLEARSTDHSECLKKATLVHGGPSANIDTNERGKEKALYVFLICKYFPLNKRFVCLRFWSVRTSME